MRHGKNHGVAVFDTVKRSKLESVFLFCTCLVRNGVADDRLDSVLGKLVYNVDDPCVSCIGAVFLKGEAQNGDLGIFYRASAFRKKLDERLHNVLTHVIVDASARKNDLTVIADLLGLIRQIVRVNADAVTADKTGGKLEEIPLCSRRLEDGFGVDSELMEDNRKLVHKGDIDIPLAVFDDLCRLGNLDAFGSVYAGFDNKLIDLGNRIKRLFVHTRNDFYDGFKPMYLVARVDSFGAVPDFKVNAAC